MKQNEEEIQYYYDSSADQWWCYDEQQQCWVPWQEEEQGEAGNAEPSADEAGVTDAGTANGARAAGSDAATKDDAECPPSSSESAEEEVPDAAGSSASPAGKVVSELHRDKKSTTDSAGGPAEATAERGKKIEVEKLTAPAVFDGGAEGSTKGDAEGVSGTGRATQASSALTDVHAAARTVGSEEEGGGHKTTTNNRRNAHAIRRRTTHKEAGDEKGKEKAENLKRESEEEGKKQKEVEKEDDVSDEAGDHLRSALESLATIPCLDEALVHIGSSSSMDRLRTFSLTGRNALPPEWLQEHTGAEVKEGNLDKEALSKLSSLQSAFSGKSSGDPRLGADDEEDDDEDYLGEPPKPVKHDPIVRRSTRMLTFKDKGGLSGCLREAAKQRNNMIMEAGGYIPGTEQYRQEAWKQRARELASQTHERSQRRWQEAAKKVFNAAGGEASPGRAMHFTDVVEKIRRKSELDKHQPSPLQAGMTRFSADAVDNMHAEPVRTRKSVGQEFLAASLLLKPEVELREQRRRSSGFPGGQHGHVRFADAAFRDPNSQLQMQDLLTQQSRRKPTYGEEDLAASAAEIRKQYTREEDE